MNSFKSDWRKQRSAFTSLNPPSTFAPAPPVAEHNAPARQEQAIPASGHSLADLSIHAPAPQPAAIQLQKNEGIDSQGQSAQPKPASEGRRENRTGLPDTLKAGVERLSGYSLSDIRVHYNSPAPTEVGALAYTQGTEIHVGPGQERHLAHEAWHVVQQMQGRVQPTMQMKGVAINDDDGLEREADVMGEKAKRTLVGSPQRQEGSGSDVANSFYAPPVHSLMADTVQRKSQWYRPQPDPDPNADAVAAIVAQIDGIVQEARNFVLSNPLASIFQTLDGYTKRWLGVFDAFRSRGEKDWLSTSIGYVIESYTNFKMSPQIGNYAILLQQTRGGTRPDFVIQDTTTNQEVAWLDITSSASVGHINRKSGQGWKNRTYVAEILYDKVTDEEFLNAAKAVGGDQALSQEQLKSLQVGKIQKEVWKKMLGQASQDLRKEFNTNYTPPGTGKNLQKNQDAVRQKLAAFFGIDVGPKLAAGLLQVIGLNYKTKRYGLKNIEAADLEQAREVLAIYADEHYEERGFWDSAAIGLSTTLNAPTSGPTDALFGGDLGGMEGMGMSYLLENHPEQLPEIFPTFFYDEVHTEQVSEESSETDETPEAKRRRLKQEEE